MKKYLLLILITGLFFSCKSLLSEDKHFSDLKEGTVFKLKLNPTPGSAYHYDVVNETDIKFEVEDKKVVNSNRSTAGILYQLDKDTSGNFLFTMKYDKVGIYSKSGDNETEYDGDKGVASIDPIEKMLGILTAYNLSITITPAGEVKAINGYREMTDKLMEQFTMSDETEKAAAKVKWEQIIKDGLVKKNIDQLFRIFPDSTLHIRDKWKLKSRQAGDLNMDVTTTYFLKDINNEIALIETSADIVSDSLPSDLMGYEVAADLKGSQFGEIMIETKTGMLVSARLSAKIEGTLELMEREIPVLIETRVEIKSKKIK